MRRGPISLSQNQPAIPLFGNSKLGSLIVKVLSIALSQSSVLLGSELCYVVRFLFRFFESVGFDAISS